MLMMGDVPVVKNIFCGLSLNGIISGTDSVE
jgi:hypothetical protein